ncbi:hypothetical protein HanPSC8_Chr11g0496571 [Helianthus annuus]|nr:hypothetical protein HanPSC8_Chr11g0496571 [Helianthus annuus]
MVLSLLNNASTSCFLPQLIGNDDEGDGLRGGGVIFAGRTVAQDEYDELRFKFGIELDDVLLRVQTRLPLNGTSLNTRKLDEETENLSHETRPKSYFCVE